MLAISRIGRRGAVLALMTLLAACAKENTFVPPPPPKVGVAYPLQQSVEPYLEATGNMTAINTVNLVARVQGFVQSIEYKDGSTV